MVDLIDVVLEGFKDVVDWVVGLFMDGLTTGYNTLTEEMFGTPTPQTNGPFVFGEPTNAPWSAIQDALVGGEIMLIALLLLVMSVQGRHTIQIFNIGSAYEARKTKENRVGWCVSDNRLVLGRCPFALHCRWFLNCSDARYGFASKCYVGVPQCNTDQPGVIAVICANRRYLDVGIEALFYIREILSTYISTECRLRLLSDMEISPLCLILRWDSVGGLSPCRPSAASRDSVQRI